MGGGPRPALQHAHRAATCRFRQAGQPDSRPSHQRYPGETPVARALQHRPGLLGAGVDPMALLRRIARYLGIAVLVVLCVIGAALVTTQTGWFKDYLRGLVVRQAAQYLNGTLTIEHLKGSVLTGIELDGVA